MAKKGRKKMAAEETKTTEAKQAEVSTEDGTLGGDVIVVTADLSKVEGAKDEFSWIVSPRIEPQHAPDSVRVRNCLESLGYQCTLKQAYDLWRAYSSRHNDDDPTSPLNNWFPLPENFDGIVSKLRHNIIPEFGGPKL